MIVIGTTGRARSGKSTVGYAIVGTTWKYNMSGKQYEFGQLVLDYCISSGRLPNKNRHELTLSEIHTLLLVGNEQRAVHPDFWASRLDEQMAKDKPDVAVICGVRFPNEVSLVKAFGGYLIRVRSLNPDGTEFISPDRDPNDVTETSLLNEKTDFLLTAYRGESKLLFGYGEAVLAQIVWEALL